MCLKLSLERFISLYITLSDQLFDNTGLKKMRYRSDKITQKNGLERKIWNETSLKMKIPRYRGKTSHDFDGVCKMGLCVHNDCATSERK